LKIEYFKSRTFNRYLFKLITKLIKMKNSETYYMKDAQYYLPTKKGNPQLFFRIENIKINDGSVYKCLQYLSTCGGGWMGSSKNPNYKDFIKNKLIKIEKK